MAKRLRLEDWIEKKVTVNILMEPVDAPMNASSRSRGFWRASIPWGSSCYSVGETYT